MKVGDKVKTRFGKGVIRKLYGEKYWPPILVEHNKPHEGLHNASHLEDLDIEYPINTCWLFEEGELKICRPKKKPKKKDYIYILMSYGQSEDRVVDSSLNEKKLKAQRQYLEANFKDYSFGLIKKRLK